MATFRYILLLAFVFIGTFTICRMWPVATEPVVDSQAYAVAVALCSVPDKVALHCAAHDCGNVTHIEIEVTP